MQKAKQIFLYRRQYVYAIQFRSNPVVCAHKVCLINYYEVNRTNTDSRTNLTEINF